MHGRLFHFKQTWNDSFEFTFVSPNKLTGNSERAVYDATPRIIALIGGLPSNVKEIMISETMRMEAYAFVEAVGIWNPPNIIIKRTQLGSLEEYAGSLLHEIAHACSGWSQISFVFTIFNLPSGEKWLAYPRHRRSKRNALSLFIRG